MSDKNTRVVEKVYHAEVSTEDKDTVVIKFHGTTTTGTKTIVKVSMDWWMWPYLVREVLKAWAGIKKRRQEEIERIDKSFPSQEW